MDFIYKYLKDNLGKDLTIRILQYEPDARTFHQKVDIDNRVVMSKNITCRELIYGNNKLKNKEFKNSILIYYIIKIRFQNYDKYLIQDYLY